MKSMCARLLLPACVLATAACTPLPPRSPQAPEWLGSPNYNSRKANFVVLHHTGDNDAATALATLTSSTQHVSAHYLVGRNGKVWQLVDENARAWHAGAARWGTTTDINSVSIGIELDNNGSEAYPDSQIDALLLLLEDVRKRNGIPRANVLGHGDIAPGRKFDPGVLFPWKRLASRGFGLWCEAPGLPLADGVNLALGLQLLGYDMTRPDAALAAFRRHYRQLEIATAADDEDQAMVQCLLRQRTPVTPP